MLIDHELEMAKTRRECYERAIMKITAEQIGEAWVGLDDRRVESTRMRGLDRRVADV